MRPLSKSVGIRPDHQRTGTRRQNAPAAALGVQLLGQAVDKTAVCVSAGSVPHTGEEGVHASLAIGAGPVQ